MSAYAFDEFFVEDDAVVVSVDADHEDHPFLNVNEEQRIFWIPPLKTAFEIDVG